MHHSARPVSGGRNTGLTLALISAFAFGGSGVAAKPLIGAGIEPLHVTWLRVAGAALVLLPFAVRHREVLRRRPLLLVGFGLFAVAGVQAFYFGAISRVPVGVALLIEYLGPALVLGWVRFVQRKPVSRAAGVGVVLAVGGLACVVEIWSGLAFDTLGLLLGLGAACCQAGYFVLADHGSGGEEPVDPLAVTAFGLLIGTLVLTVVARPWAMEWQVLGQHVAMGDRDVPALLLLAWVVLIATVLAYLTGVVSVRRLSPQVAGVVAFLEAVIATLLAWVLLREHLSAPQLVGGAAVLVGAFVAQTAAPGRSATVEPVPVSLPDGSDERGLQRGRGRGPGIEAGVRSMAESPGAARSPTPPTPPGPSGPPTDADSAGGGDPAVG